MITEFLLKLAAEATLLSTGAAFVRRYAGFDMPRMMAQRIKHEQLRNAANKYLDLGEYCADKTIQAVKYVRSSEFKQRITPKDSGIKKE